MTAFTARTRGEFADAADARMRLHWRLDGSAKDPQAPLLLALHGYGMHEDLFAILLQGLSRLPWNIVTPRAPIPIPEKPGMSWYDYDGNQQKFRQELHRTNDLLTSFLHSVEQQQGLAPRHRVLLGFSQGGYCGSYVALQNPQLFNGMVISGARVKVEVLEDVIHVAGKTGFRALLCHGKRDESVQLTAAQSSLAGLRDGGIAADLKQFDTGHSVGRTQVAAIRQWLETF